MRTTIAAICTVSVEQAHLNRHPTGDDGLAPLRRASSMSAAFQNPKTADVLLGLQERSVGDDFFDKR